MDFVAVVEQIKKRMKKTDQNLIPAGTYLQFPTIFIVTSEPLGAAFRKFVRGFLSYSRAN
jgi:hypothetical protein